MSLNCFLSQRLQSSIVAETLHMHGCRSDSSTSCYKVRFLHDYRCKNLHSTLTRYDEVLHAVCIAGLVVRLLLNNVTLHRTGWRLWRFYPHTFILPCCKYPSALHAINLIVRLSPVKRLYLSTLCLTPLDFLTSPDGLLKVIVSGSCASLRRILTFRIFRRMAPFRNFIRGRSASNWRR